MQITPTPKIWMDGEFVNWEDAKVHVLTHSLHYGTGVFEGIRAYETNEGTAIFRLGDHTSRLFRSARLLSIEIPFTEAEISAATLETVRISGVSSCYIRPLVYLGYGEIGLNPLPCDVHVAIACFPWGAYLGEDGIKNGVRLKVSSWARHDTRAMPTAAKATGMYINSSLAKVEVIRAGYDEAVMLTTDGYVAECTGENIFTVRNGVLLTPPNSAVGALEGITAASITTLARDLGYEVKETLMRRTDLYMADEAFLTGTAAEVVPISSVDDRVIGNGKPGPITRAVQEMFYSVLHGDVDRYKDWLDHVE